MENKIYYNEEITIKDGIFKGIKGYIVETEIDDISKHEPRTLAKVKVDSNNIITVPLDHIKSEYSDYLVYVKNIETGNIEEIIGNVRLKKDDLLGYIEKIYKQKYKKFEREDYSIYSNYVLPYNKYCVSICPVEDLKLKLDNYIIPIDMIKKIFS